MKYSFDHQKKLFLELKPTFEIFLSGNKSVEFLSIFFEQKLCEFCMYLVSYKWKMTLNFIFSLLVLTYRLSQYIYKGNNVCAYDIKFNLKTSYLSLYNQINIIPYCKRVLKLIFVYEIIKNILSRTCVFVVSAI